MEPRLSKKINRNFEFIERNIIRLGKVMDKLVSDGHLSASDKTDIMGGRTRDKEIALLLDKLIKRGGTSFTSFIDALKSTGNERISDQILQTDSSDESIPRDEPFFSENTSDFREDEILHLYKEKQMYKVKLTEMTTNFTHLESELVIKENKIESLSNEILKLQRDLEDARHELMNDGDMASDIFRRMNTGAGSKELMIKIRDLQYILEEKEQTVCTLQKDLNYYKEQLDFADKQLKKHRDEQGEKDARIMVLRNQVGKLQTYLQANKQNLHRIATEQKKVLEQWSKEHLEKFTEIEAKMESGKKDQSTRFNTLEDKIDTLIKMMSGNSPTLPQKNAEKHKGAQKAHHNKEAQGKKSKSNRYKN